MPEFVKYQTEGLLQGVKYDPKDVPEGTAIYVGPAPPATAYPASIAAAMSGISVTSPPRRSRNLEGHRVQRSVP